MVHDSITNTIRQKCLDAGFMRAGIARAEELKKESVYFKSWLDEDRNGSMSWMNKSFEKRVNPGLIMEDVKSVISLAYLYDTPVAHSEDRNIPKISRYAWGERDYHKIIKKKLKLLCRDIEGLSQEIRTRYYADDGPVMDKAWAVRAGIGWIGKHTNVINRDIGSFFFIATILLNIELKYDIKTEDLCGSCALCISACPTGALYDEYKLDSNLCISYQTIENHDEIPEELNLDGWIFGCDTCQDVCPYNSKKFYTEDPGFFPKKELLNKSFGELLKINEEQFNSTFRGTPVMRTKYKGWTRNLNKFQREING